MPNRLMPNRPILIAHRGASADRPEHTLASYRRAIRLGADFIEPDLVPTRDGVLVARHENEISGTTNVADFPDFADRKTIKRIDGTNVAGWFTEDFTLAELKKLRARERLPHLRPANTAWADETIPTFDEILALADEEGKARGRPVGVYPETKHPEYFRRLGLALERPLLAALDRHGRADATDRVFIQSFEPGNLQWLAQRTPLPLVQLLSRVGRPADGSPFTYRDMCKPQGLRHVASYAAAIGPDKEMLGVSSPADVPATTGSGLVTRAHDAGLLVHPWTFRPENHFLPRKLRSSRVPTERGDLVSEILGYLRAGIDGFFSDSTDIARLALDRFGAG